MTYGPDVVETFMKVSLEDRYHTATAHIPLTTDQNREDFLRALECGDTVYRRWEVAVHRDGTRTTREMSPDLLESEKIALEDRYEERVREWERWAKTPEGLAQIIAQQESERRNRA